MEIINIGVAGCLGNMGRELVKKVIENPKVNLTGGFEHKEHKLINKKLSDIVNCETNLIVSNSAEEIFLNSNVVIDFTTPESSLVNIEFAQKTKTPLVIGTTGLSLEINNKIIDASNQVALLQSTNMSLGVNLLFHLPIDVITRKKIVNLNKENIGSIVIIKIKVQKHIIPKFRRQPYRVNCICNNLPIDIVFFNARHPYIKLNLPINKDCIISGKLEFFNNIFQITHPEYIINPDNISYLKTVQPIYTLTKGLTQKVYLKIIQYAIKKLVV